jgi:cholera toxin transcriptional activator
MRTVVTCGHDDIVAPAIGTAKLRTFMPAAQPELAGRVLKFGIFEADLNSGELRKNGTRVRMQEQPFQLLAFLLQRPQQVISRTELREKLWHADTFVDFDHSLNTAVNKVREALGDSASSPRFIETIARRGYRFLAPVEVLGVPSTHADSRSNLHPELEVPLPHRSLTRALFAAIQVMYVCLYLAALMNLSRVDEITRFALPVWAAVAITAATVVTGGVGIPLRSYLISAVAFDHKRLGEKFLKLFPLIFPLDELWAIAPFLIAHKIGIGAAFAATAALLYVPFSERTLIRLAYPESRAA